MFSKFFKPSFNKGLTLNIKRFFDLHEYQSKDVMRRFGVLVQKGDIATTPEQAEQVAKNLNVKDGILILKAQVQAGGRGKGNFFFNNRSPHIWTQGWCPNLEDSSTSQLKNQTNDRLQFNHSPNHQIRS